MWHCESEKHQPRQLWYPPLEKLFREVMLFDPYKEQRELGPEGAKKKFLETVSARHPDYVLFFGAWEIFTIQTILEVNRLSPRTKTLMFFGDDDVQFEKMSRYYALFVDYVIVGQTQFLGRYEQEGLHNALPIWGANASKASAKCDKIYDVALIGTPVQNRAELVRFLTDNGIDIRLWGHGWSEYPEFSKIYGGPLDSEDFIKITRQSKISLSPTQSRYGPPHIKGRVFEIAACGEFQLVGYFSEYLKYFRENKEIVMYKNNDDLLKKIKYYLANSKERERIAYNSYKKIAERYNLLNSYVHIFGTILSHGDNVRGDLPKLGKKVAVLPKKDLARSLDELSEKISGADYIRFSAEECETYEYCDYLLARALEKTKKDISCCEYDVNLRPLGKCMIFQLHKPCDAVGTKYINSLLTINQIMVTKKFFLNNFEQLRRLANNKHVEIINENNTAFIAVPLFGLRKFSKTNYSDMQKAFRTDILHRLQFSMHSGRLLSFICGVLAASIYSRSLFLPRCLIESIFPKIAKKIKY